MELIATYSGDEYVHVAIEDIFKQNLSTFCTKRQKNTTTSIVVNPQPTTIPITLHKYQSSFANPEANLLSQPFLHLFFTACPDEKTYKTNNVREQLTTWYRSLQEDYHDYSFKQQALVITVNGEIPNLIVLAENSSSSQPQSNTFPSPSPTRAETPPRNPKLLQRSDSLGKKSSPSASSSIILTGSSTSAASRIVFNKSVPVAELCKEDLEAIASEYENPSDCLITTLHEPLRTNYQKSEDSWNKVCSDIASRFEVQLHNLIQNHQHNVEKIRIEKPDLREI